MKNVVKRTYRKPEIVRVKLNPEEAVLTFCKTSVEDPACNTGGTPDLEFGS
ncbi:MAG: hypothetical protein KJ779_13625 [Firmicutes bacterium]|nr:hypothetical protein [Bacillota bacterium]